MFLRFLVMQHGLPPGVIGAVPTIRQWKLASLPKHLSVDEVDRTLATCDAQSPVGKRDRAILLLLLRLALRAGEVAVFAFQTSTGEKGRFESTLRNPRANESCPCRMTLAKLWRNTCKTVGPRVFSLTSSYAPARRSARSMAPVQ